MAVYFAIFQILPTFVYELFETMQSSVTRSRTSITKSLPASFKLSIFSLFSESYIKIHCFSLVKPFVSKVKTLGFDYRKLSFQLVGTSKGIYMKQPKQIPFPSKSICFGIKVLYFGEDLKNTILFYSFDYCYGSCFI